MPRRPLSERAMTSAERQKRYRQAIALTTSKGKRAAADYLSRRKCGPHDSSDGTVTIEALAEIFFCIYWSGRLGAARRLDPDAGDWESAEERAFWRSEVERWAAGQPLEILR